jgi:hypothetical protein
MTSSPTLRELALSVLAKKRDSAWDSSGTGVEKLSQCENPAGTPFVDTKQSLNPTVPLSRPLGQGQWDTQPVRGTAVGTVVGQTGICARCGHPVEGEPWDYDGLKVHLHQGACERLWVDAQRNQPTPDLLQRR